MLKSNVLQKNQHLCTLMTNQWSELIISQLVANNQVNRWSLKTTWDLVSVTVIINLKHQRILALSVKLRLGILSSSSTLKMEPRWVLNKSKCKETLKEKFKLCHQPPLLKKLLTSSNNKRNTQKQLQRHKRPTNPCQLISRFLRLPNLLGKPSLLTILIHYLMTVS